VDSPLELSASGSYAAETGAGQARTHEILLLDVCAVFEEEEPHEIQRSDGHVQPQREDSRRPGAIQNLRGHPPVEA